MVQAQSRLTTISGTFFRVIFTKDGDHALKGAASPQGRYHHDQQPALYLSPKLEWAWKAMETYIRPGDPAREVRQFQIKNARVVDIRDRAFCRELGIVPSDSDVPWLPAGQRPSTWNVSDLARQAGADGLVYTSRIAPERWYLALFRWNSLGGPTVSISGEMDPSLRWGDGVTP